VKDSVNRIFQTQESLSNFYLTLMLVRANLTGILFLADLLPLTKQKIAAQHLFRNVIKV
jgi:hypothetical protein